MNPKKNIIEISLLKLIFFNRFLVTRGFKEGLEDLFLYQTDLLENTPGDPDPNEDEGVFLDWVDARHPKTIDFKIIRIRNRFIIEPIVRNPR